MLRLQLFPLRSPVWCSEVVILRILKRILRSRSWELSLCELLERPRGSRSLMLAAISMVELRTLQSISRQQ
jgi:hypothetical protein